MKVTRHQLRAIIREERARLREDAIDTELKNLKKNVANDLDHIKDLKDDVEDDHEEEIRAEKEKRKDETYRKLRKMIREERARILNEAADPKVDSVAGIVQTAVDSGDSAIMDMADKLQAAGLPAEYMSGMGMRYVQVPHKRGHIVVISKNSVQPDSETVIVGPYAIGYMGE